jgi:DNA-binding NarL/FixJ family response regulator
MGDTAQNGSNVGLAWPAVERRRLQLRAISSGGMEKDNRQDMRAEARQPVTTVLIGPSSLFLEGLRHILDKTDFRVVAVKSKAEQWIRRQAQEPGNILFIVDGGRESEVACRQIQALKQRHPEAFITALIDSNQLTDFALLFQAGAKACLAKGVSSSIFLKSLELVMLGETLLPSSILSSMCARLETQVLSVPGNAPQARLSAQEERILGFLVKGHSNKAIARELAITDATVKVHVKAILKKIGAQNRTQAAIWATRNPGFDRARRESEAASFVALATPAVPHAVETALTVEAREDRKLEDKSAEAGTQACEEATPKVISRTNFLRQASAWRAARRIAEDEERRDALAAKINHLRELREAGTLQAG